jgi:hypothetical protein
LSPAGLDQTGAFEFLNSVRDGRPLDSQHFGKEALRDLKRVIVTTVAHHEQPTC